MATARVQLASNGPISYSVGDVKFERGAPLVTTNDELIEKCKANNVFTVTLLTAPKAKAIDSGGEPKATKLSIKGLNEMTKADLVSLAQEKFELVLNPADKKDNLVADIMDAQEQLSKL